MQLLNGDKYKKDIGDGAQKGRHLKMVMGWIPINERLPEAGKHILVSFANEEILLPDIATYQVDEDGNGAFYPEDKNLSYAMFGFFVNAWMPLPKPYREV